MRYGNPMGESPRKRAAWVDGAGVPVPILRDLGRPVDVLWIVECYAAYYPRGQDNARATARVLAALGVDFAILGTEEKCAGECARLVGEKGLFDTLREQNMATFGKYEFRLVAHLGSPRLRCLHIRVPVPRAPIGRWTTPRRSWQPVSTPSGRASPGSSGTGSPTTTPACSAGTTTCTTSRDASSRPFPA